MRQFHSSHSYKQSTSINTSMYIVRLTEYKYTEKILEF